MAAVVRTTLGVAKLCRTSTPMVKFSRNGSDLLNMQVSDWKPGPYPKTQAEREAAAAKYGMLVEDYKPYPDDGEGYGDYPMIDIVSAEARDQFEWFPDHRNFRNFGEVMHIHADMYTEDRINHNEKHSVPIWKQAACFFGFYFGSMFLYYLGDYYAPPVPKMPKQIPFEADVHYGF